MSGNKIDRSILENQQSIEPFRAAISNAATLDPYERRLIAFLNTIKMTPDAFIALDKDVIESMIISFISAQKSRAEKREITAGTVGNAVKAVRVLCEMNDIINLNWKKIKRTLPKARRYALDRIPTIKEVQNIVEAADIRGKALTYTFISSGIREGSIESLKVSDFTRTEGVGRLVIYNGDPDRYVTFISSEACNALDKYLDFRREHGEVVTADSPLFRDKFDPIKGLEGRGNHGHTRKDAKEIIIPMTGPSIRQYYNRLLFSIGIRKERQRRHEFSVHGLRKYFKTKAEQAGMKPIHVEILMGHSTGISDSYYPPTENDLLQDYLNVVDNLTANEQKLQLDQKQQDTDTKLSDSQKEVQALKEQLQKRDKEWDDMKETISAIEGLKKDIAELQRAKGAAS